MRPRAVGARGGGARWGWARWQLAGAIVARSGGPGCGPVSVAPSTSAAITKSARNHGIRRAGDETRLCYALHNRSTFRPCCAPRRLALCSVAMLLVVGEGAWRRTEAGEEHRIMRLAPFHRPHLRHHHLLARRRRRRRIELLPIHLHLHQTDFNRRVEDGDPAAVAAAAAAAATAVAAISAAAVVWAARRRWYRRGGGSESGWPRQTDRAGGAVHNLG